MIDISNFNDENRDVMRAANYIKQLIEHNSRLDKEAILQKAWDDQAYSLFIGFMLSYNILTTFGVKQIDEKVEPDSTDDLQICGFLELATKLARRELTGNAAQDAIDEARRKASKDTWNYFYRNVLLKDLKCGTTHTTANKVLKKISKKDPQALEFITPVFSCQLAHDGLKHPKKMVGKKLLDNKLDGVRLLTVCDVENGTVIQYTRNGRVNENFEALRVGFQTLMLPNLTESMVFDGEVTSANFQQLMTQVNRKGGVDTSDANLALFDIIPLKDFNKGIYKVPQHQRHKDLKELINKWMFLFPEVFVLDQIEVDLDTTEGRQTYDEFFDKAIDMGFEGIMIKDPNAPYECKRSAAYLKQKPFIELDLTVVGSEEGTGKNAGVLGALICEGKDDDGNDLKVNVGGGYSEDQRDVFWHNMHNVMGQIITVRADAVTQNADGTYSLRFPRFRHFRSIDGAAGVKD